MRLCSICKIPILKSSFCAYCLTEISRLREPFVRDEKVFAVHSLFSWRHLSPPALSWMVQSLKGQECENAWRELAVAMLEKFGPLSPTVFVPIPSLKRNHAVGLARALSDLSGFPMRMALSPGQNASQKKLSRERRLEVHFERELWSFYTEDMSLTVVDDVVTTGATIRAAFHALGRPRRIQGWCLLDRRPCAPSRELL